MLVPLDHLEQRIKCHHLQPIQSDLTWSPSWRSPTTFKTITYNYNHSTKGHLCRIARLVFYVSIREKPQNADKPHTITKAWEASDISQMYLHLLATLTRFFQFTMHVIGGWFFAHQKKWPQGEIEKTCSFRREIFSANDQSQGEVKMMIIIILKTTKNNILYIYIWGLPKIMVPPNHSNFGDTPYFWKHPYIYIIYLLLFVSNHAIFWKGFIRQGEPRGRPKSPLHQFSNSDFNQIRFKLRDRC